MERLYSFVNSPYLQGIQCGIQTGHAVEQMWLKYSTPVSTTFELMNAEETQRIEHFIKLRMFAKNDKTWIILAGGDHDTLYDLFCFMMMPDNHYPWASFKEPGLNNTFTSICIVIPERLYDKCATNLGKVLLDIDYQDDRVGYHAASVWKNRLDSASFEAAQQRLYTKWEVEFLKRKAKCNLAT